MSEGRVWVNGLVADPSQVLATRDQVCPVFHFSELHGRFPKEFFSFHQRSKRLAGGGVLEWQLTNAHLDSVDLAWHIDVYGLGFFVFF